MLEAEESLHRTNYLGPVPLTFDAYLSGTGISMVGGRPDARTLSHALRSMVLKPEVASRVCLALTSGRPTLLWGPAGTGKTMILDCCSTAMAGVITLPVAVYAGGHVIQLFDESVHVQVGGGADHGVASDQRWVRVRRPFVFVGGELRPQDLNLTFDATLGCHHAPPHIKANGGLLAIDDLGRQEVSPTALLNRWISALERGEDALTLVTGERLTFPFAASITFSTNLDPSAVFDEAQLRRLPYKIETAEPSDDELAELFSRAAREYEVAVPQGGITQAVALVRHASGGRPRSCHARDILQLVIDEAEFVGRRPVLTPGAVNRACHMYFARTSREQSPVAA